MHEHFMRIAIEEAKKGIGAVNPNPLVGAVIVKNNKIISVGHHEFYGGPHAEVNALKNLESVEGATLYVTLEPCSHFGKTPPCTELIIKSKIKTCIVGTLDLNPCSAKVETKPPTYCCWLPARYNSFSATRLPGPLDQQV